jgi:DNA-binding response OmpR family regulator
MDEVTSLKTRHSYSFIQYVCYNYIMANFSYNHQGRPEQQPKVMPEAISLADGQVLVGPEFNTVRIHHTLKRTHPMDFQVLWALGAKVDETVTYGELVQAVWGWENLSSRDNERMRNALYGHVSKLRERLGDQLGDVDTGVIRTVTDIGYMALSHLED